MALIGPSYESTLPRLRGSAPWFTRTVPGTRFPTSSSCPISVRRAISSSQPISNGATVKADVATRRWNAGALVSGDEAVPGQRCAEVGRLWIDHDGLVVALSGQDGASEFLE